MPGEPSSSSAAADAVAFDVSWSGFHYSVTYGFLLSLALGMLVVYFFSYQKFDETTLGEDENDIITRLLPKYLTTKREYTRAFIVYLAIVQLVLVLVSFLGPKLLEPTTDNLSVAPSSLPLVTALVIVGILPNVTWLKQLELRVRSFAHERASIPQAARSIARQLAAAEFDFSGYASQAALRSPLMRGVEKNDLKAPRESGPG